MFYRRKEYLPGDNQNKLALSNSLIFSEMTILLPATGPQVKMYHCYLLLYK
jgi:hypothetical protein